MSALDTREHEGEGMPILPARDRWQAIRFLGPPLVYLGDLVLSLMIAPHAARTHRKMLLHAVAFTALLLIAASTVSSILAMRRDATESGRTIDHRRRFLAWAGIGLGVMSLLLVIAGEIPNLLLDADD